MDAFTIHFGAPVKNEKSVPKEISALGLNFLPTSPSSVNMTVVNHFVQPGHALYKNFLPSHMKCAKSRIYLSTRVPPFHPIEESELSPAFDAPTMIWSTGTKLDAERIAQYKVDYGVKETQARGKLAFEMKYDATIWQKVKTEVNPITTTPTNTTNVNVAGMRVLFLLHKLVTQFFKTNQYPAFFDNDKSHVAPWCYEVSGGVGDAERTMEDGSKVRKTIADQIGVEHERYR